MKYFLLFLSINIIGFNGLAQKGDYNSVEIPFGKSIDTQEELRAKTYQIKGHVPELMLDSLNGTINLKVLSKKPKSGRKQEGELIKVHVESFKELWNRSFIYTKSPLKQFGIYSIKSMPTGSYCLKNSDGSKSWSSSATISYVDKESNTGLGYYNDSQISGSMLQGVDLTNGNQKWQRTIDRKYGWNQIKKVNNSTLMVVSSGLHSVNLNSGKGWTVTGKTFQPNYEAIAVASVAGALGGLLLSSITYYGLGYGGKDYIVNLVSNLLSEDDSYYLACKDKIFRVSKNGELIWETELMKSKTSSSKIAEFPNSIGMLNLGYAIYPNLKHTVGKPYLTSFDKVSGEVIFTNNFEGLFGNTKILGFQNTDSTWDILFNMGMYRFNGATGDTVNYRLNNVSEYGEFQRLINADSTYVLDENRIKSLNEVYPDNFFIQSESGLCVVLDKRLKLVNVLNISDLSYLSFKTEELTFIRNPNSVNLIAIDSKGNSILEVYFTDIPIKFGSKLIYRLYDGFAVVDLSDINSKD